MKKDDGISILLSIIINIIIVLLIPSLSANKVENKKIKIGLVAYEIAIHLRRKLLKS